MSLYEQLLQSDRFFLIAGPCVIEDNAVVRQIMESLLEETARRGITLIFKASYRKANRTSLASFTGPGLSDGLAVLADLKREYNVPILTDVHECAEVTTVAEVADVLQIPAFLSRQTALIQSAADSGRIVNIKKGQFMAPQDMQAAADKATAGGNQQVMLTERGTSFGYHNLVVDFRGFAIMHDIGYPVVYDVTHSLQRPSLDATSGGEPEFARMMARAAMATGMVSGLFIETHPEPGKALSDAATMLPLSELGDILDDCVRQGRRP
ncbi:MAG: 3-deoxy-8-phosphooctulonate synthase [Candidatus Cloacimonetes bacterium]|nr:3-deoxy-8-phosphooctulonate synthase [Candidatus Cloacimonadota bacterium]